MLKTNKQQDGKDMLAPFNKAGLLLVGALALGMAVGCSDGAETETAAEPTASESVATEPAPEAVEPEVAPEEEVVEEVEPEAEASETIESEASIEAEAAAPLSAEAGAELYEAHCKLCHEKVYYKHRSLVIKKIGHLVSLKEKRLYTNTQLKDLKPCHHRLLMG